MTDSIPKQEFEHKFAEGFQNLVDELRGNPNLIDHFSTAHQKFLSDVEDIVLPTGVKRGTELQGGAQSKQFMIQLLPHIHAYMSNFPLGSQFSVLDIGPGSGFGSQLLASLYQRTFLGYKISVQTTDISPDYINFAKFFCPYINAIQQDIFTLENSYDIVIASHVTEHVPNWRPFVERMKALSRGIVIVCSPYREDKTKVTYGHCNIFDDAELAEIKPKEIHLVESPAWGQMMTPRYKMFIAILEGNNN